MPYQHPFDPEAIKIATLGEPEEIPIIDKYGDARVMRKTRRGYQLKRVALTPQLALTKRAAVIFGQRVKALRLARGWTLAYLCDRAGIPDTQPKQRMWSIENSVRREGVNLGTVYQIAIALGVELEDVLPSVADMQEVAAPKITRQQKVALR